MITINLDEPDIDVILDLLSRKIEKANEKEIDEEQVQYRKNLESLKASIEAQISN